MTRAADASLAPGFMVVHGNHPESLCELMVAWMRAHPLAPLEDEVVLVQSNGIAQWLKLALAADHAHGIAAALQTQLPAQALWDMYRAVLGRAQVPPQSPFDKSQLVWRLMRLLPGLLAQPEFQPLQRFLENDRDGRKRHQLAIRLADLLDQYQVYRADWLAAWADGRRPAQLLRADGQAVELPAAMRWQPLLWRALLADVQADDPGEPASRAHVHQAFLAAVRDWQGPRPAGLPRRISVFGISSLPQQTLEVLAAVARWSQVLLCVHNPCQHDWSYIVPEGYVMRRQLRRADFAAAVDEASLHLQTHPLLAAWGRQGRDFLRLLDEHDEREGYAPRFEAIGQRVDLFASNGADTLLRQLQDDILQLRTLPETQQLAEPVDPARDRSIAFHVAHGPQREVEVLHDALLQAFSDDPTLRPGDVIVMVPDIAAYAPHIQAVFGRIPRGDERWLPFAIADQGQRQTDPLLAALEKLLSLPEARLAAGEVLDLLQVPALRTRFGIAEDQLPLVQHWLEAAGIRWGLDAEHRASLQLPAGMDQNSWSFGLRRMLLGYAVGEGGSWNGIEPLGDIGGTEAQLLGPLVRLADTLQRHWVALQTAASPAVWTTRLQALLADFFEAGDGSAEGLTLLRAHAALQEWREACAAGGLHEPLPLAVVREHWLGSLEPPGLRQPFFGGGITFASLMPMRAIPFRRVALLGMNDGDYPRSRAPMDFDLMAHEHRAGDRSRREDDRYLFLEALLSAREHLHVSWVGRSIHDNEERPPSVLVAQLRDHLAAGWRLPQQAGFTPRERAAFLAALTVEHRLQPFHPAYFAADGDPRLFSYAREWRASLEAPADPGADAALPPPPARAFTLRQLGDFVKHPARFFLQQRLQVRFGEEDPVASDEEPFDLDGLAHWKLQHELIAAQRAAIDAAPAQAQERRAEALRAQLERIARRGELPHGPFAAQQMQVLAEPMEALFAAYAQQLATWPQVLSPQPLDEVTEVDGVAWQLQDWLGELRADAEGARCRLVLESTGMVSGKAFRHDKLLPYWVAHLAGHLGGQPLTTIVLSKNGHAEWPPLAVDDARRHWQALLQAWSAGWCAPLPFAPGIASAWLKGLQPKKARRNAGPPVEPGVAARRAAEAAFAELRERDVCVARAYPDFAALWGEGAFEHWTRALLEPLVAHLRTLGTPGEGEAE